MVIDYHACVEYLSKYACKGEPRSQLLKHVFSSIVHNCTKDTNPTKLIKKVIMKSLGQRDYSAQEVMHHLLSLKLVSSSFKVVPVSLNGSRRVKNNPKDGDCVTNDSLLDTYAKRKQYAKTFPNILSLNFITFATKYKIVNNKVSNQSENVIPRTFPVFSSSSRGPNFGLYCKYQLLKYKPCHTTQDNAWNDQPGTDDIYINSWKTFLETPFAKENVPDWSDKLHSIQNQANNNASDEEPIQEAFEQEEWMH